MNKRGITAEVLLDSVNPVGDRLTTFKLHYHRWVLAQFNTHRAFSRSTASSRAIPVSVTLKQAEDEPALPCFWGKNQKGMCAAESISPADEPVADMVWRQAASWAVHKARELQSLGVHKQVANRLVEPFLYTSAVVSSTEWENFFSLRCGHDAQPEMQVLAWAMLGAYLNSQPRQMEVGDWHLPFTDKLTEGLSTDQLINVSVARCARVSYLNFKGGVDYDDDLRLHDDLMEDGHFSPCEHQAMCLGSSERLGNFTGWAQRRKYLPNENRRVDLHQLWANRPEWVDV